MDHDPKMKQYYMCKKRIMQKIKKLKYKNKHQNRKLNELTQLKRRKNAFQKKIQKRKKQIINHDINKCSIKNMNDAITYDDNKK